ncbi:MAG: hypothetical protein RL151_1506, partial [Bacteroidota bacterium]
EGKTARSFGGLRMTEKCERLVILRPPKDLAVLI